MEKQIVTVIVEYSGDNLSAYIKDAPIITTGKDLKEIETNIKEATELYKETCTETGIQPVKALQGEFDFKYKVDTASFINYYSNIFTKAALSRITGINERQLWHYAAGVHKPRRRQLEKIENGIHKLSTELSNIIML